MRNSCCLAHVSPTTGVEPTTKKIYATFQQIDAVNESYPNLNQEISKMLLKLRNILIEAKKAFDEDFDLSAAKGD